MSVITARSNRMPHLIVLMMAIIISICIISTCRASEASPPPQEVTLHFGHQGVRDFYAYTHGKTEDYPKIMSFSSLYWRPPNLGTVTLTHFGSSVEIPHVFWTMGTRNGRRTDGIGGIDIRAGLNQEKYVTQEHAYEAYVALIKSFKEAGWQQYFEPQDARIAKEDNLKLLLHSNQTTEGMSVPSDEFVMNTGFASDYTNILSFEEWQQVMNRKLGRDINIYMHFRDITLWLLIQKTKTRPNPIPNQPDLEQYMVRYGFDSAKYVFYRNFSDEKTLEELRQFYDEEQAKNKSIRQKYESRAIRAGFAINEDYQDPDMWQYIIEPAY